MESKPNFYAIIPADVRYNQNLTANAKLLYGEITALCNTTGECWAGNEYFAELYSVSIDSVSRWINSLKREGFIDVEIDALAGNKRSVTLSAKMPRPIRKNVETLSAKMPRPIRKNVDPIYENTTINNTINNTPNSKSDALTFLRTNYPIRFEQEFLMQTAKEFKNKTDENKFLQDFIDEVEIKKIDYGPGLFNFLKKYARNWINYRANSPINKLTTDHEKRTNPNHGQSF